MSVLILYHSRTGYTQRVAEALGGLMQAPTCAIKTRRSYRGFLGYQRCLVESAFGMDADIEPLDIHPASFDLVVIGTPIWAWHLPSPVRTFARRHADAVRQCAFFCTMGGSGAPQVFAELERYLDRTPRAKMALTDAEIDGGSAAPKLTAFVSALQQPPLGQAPVSLQQLQRSGA